MAKITNELKEHAEALTGKMIDLLDNQSSLVIAMSVGTLLTSYASVIEKQRTGDGDRFMFEFIVMMREAWEANRPRAGSSLIVPRGGPGGMIQ